MSEGWNAVVTAHGTGLVERARDVLAELGLAARIVDELTASARRQVSSTSCTGIAWQGFENEEAKLLLETETEFFGRTVPRGGATGQKLARRRGKNVVDPLKLVAGDHVVHETHGIGQFVEMHAARWCPTGVGRNATKALARLPRYRVRAVEARYTRATSCYVPTDQLDQLSRYVGGEAPPLSKMGGSDWSHAKKKARQAVRDIAVELVKLYSARMASPRATHSRPDTPWQRELEEAFPFAETLDQLTTIDEIKRDMERADADGSPAVGRRRLRQDRGRRPRGVQGDPGRQAGRDARADDAAGETALRDVPGPLRGVPRAAVRALSRFQTDKEAKETLDGSRRRNCRHGDRHPPDPHRHRDLQGSRPPHHRRGAALRRRAQGQAQEAEDERRHPRDERDADPAHARDGGHRHPRDVDARDAARGSAPDPVLRRRRAATSRSPRRSGARCCARGRCSSCTTA